MYEDEKKKVTIYDVAKAAKVSPGTVSRYINGIGEPRPKSRQRIEQAIKDLGYVPNRAARALKSKRKNLLCLAYPESDNPFFFSLVDTVEKAVKKAGYALMIYHTHGEVEEELRILSLTKEGVMDGLILVNFNYTPRHFDAFSSVDCPLVLSSLCVSPYGGKPSDPFDYVGINVRQGMYLNTLHMIREGHKKIAYVGGPNELCVFKERYEGYCQALSENNISLQEDFCFLGGYDQAAGYSAGLAIAAMEDRPTAVCAVSDVVAIGIMEALREKDIAMPGDIALCGMDDIGFDTALTPRLSSVKMRQAEIGKSAVDCLLSRINGDDSAARKMIYEPEIIVRESSLK